MKSTVKIVLLGLILLLPWCKGFDYPFLYDDIGMISENPFLVDPANVADVLSGKTLFQPDVINGRRPVVLLSLFVDRHFYGLQPTGYRLTNLVFHLLNVGLLGWLVWRLAAGMASPKGRCFVAVASMLIFDVHPVLTEAVHAPAFRADVLCVVFILLYLHVLIDSDRLSCWKPTVGVLCLALALLSKETAIVAPAGLLAVRWLTRRPTTWISGWACIRPILPGALLVGAFFIIWSAAPYLQASGLQWNGISLRPPATLWTAPALWTRTWRYLFIPWPLNVDQPLIPVVSPLSGAFVWGLLWLLAAGYGAWALRKSHPLLSFGIVWIFLFYVPVSNLWPLLHPVADRYFYPIIPGFALVVAVILGQQPASSRRWGLALMAAIYIFLLHMRLGDWQSGERLWSTALHQNPASATAATWLGLLRSDAGDAEGAAVFYREAIRQNPHQAHPYINLAVIEGKSGHLDEAERLLHEALRLSPENTSARRNLQLVQQLRADAAE